MKRSRIDFRVQGLRTSLGLCFSIEENDCYGTNNKDN